MDKFIHFLIFLALACSLSAQENQNPWNFGGLWIGQVYGAVKDTKIGAAQTPFYEDKKWGTESWINLYAHNRNWRIETRLDGYYNSILLNPEDVYTDYGIGYFNIRYGTSDFSIEAGHFYGQIGQGLIMRSYRDLSLLIDNSIFGLKTKWYLPGDQSIMLYGGRPVEQYSFQDLFNAGGEYRKNWTLKKWYLSTGAGFSWKRFHSDLTDALIDELRFYHPSDKVSVYRNGWMASVFQEVSAGPLSWNLEYAVKYHDPYFNADNTRKLVTGQEIRGRFETSPGQVFYSQISLDYEKVSLGLAGKYIHRFVNKSDPFSFDYRNDLHFIPPANDLQSYRLKSRYVPATRFLGEKSLSAFVFLPLGDHLLEWRTSLIFGLHGEKWYDDYDLQWIWTGEGTKWVGGLMYQFYNQSLYEGKGGDLKVRSFIPYVEYYNTWSKNRSLKIESQALLTRQDKGPLFYANMEWAWKQYWSVFGSTMFQSRENLWFPSVGLFYNQGMGRYGLSFVKQLEGYVCSGGICRYEPAFSGFKFEFQQRL